MQEIEWERSEPFCIEVTADSNHIDSYGHVSNVHFIQWLTDCAWAHSAAVVLPEEHCIKIERGMAIRAIHVEFLASAYEGERLKVANWVSKTDGKLRATRPYQVVNAESGKTLLRGDINFVCVNLKTGMPTRMPSIFAERYVINS